MLGEITGGGVRGYWKLENVNDSGPNGYNLTNNNSVTFGKCRLTDGAKFGSSGTNKGLTYGSNPLSALKPTQLSVSFWFKLNDTSNTATERFFFVLNSDGTSTNGIYFACLYTIVTGSLNISVRMLNSAGSATSALNSTLTADTNWHFVRCVYNNSDNLMAIRIDGITESTATPPTVASSNTVPSVCLAIGNARGLGNQVFADMDEFILSDSFYAESVTDRSNRMKYFTQAKGYFV